MTAAAIIGSRPTQRNIEIYAGEAIDFTVPVLNRNSVLQNPTGWAAASQIRIARSLPVLHTFTLDVGEDGIRVTATGTETASWVDWPVVRARWDLLVTPPPSESPLALIAGWVLVY